MTIFDFGTQELRSTIGMTLAELQQFMSERGFSLRVDFDDEDCPVEATTAECEYQDALEFYFSETSGLVAEYYRHIWD